MTLLQAQTVRTAAEVLAATSTEIAARGGDDKSFPPTSTAYQILVSYSEAQAALEALRAQIVNAGSLSLIEQIEVANGLDAWVDHLSAGVFALTREPATYALLVFRLTNAATGVARTFAPGDLRARFGSVDFINVTKSDITDYIGAGSVAPGATLDLLFEAQTAGSVGNVPTGYVTQLVTVFAGVTVSNPAITGTSSSIYRAAREQERNASLLDRDASRWGASSAGGCVGSIVEWIHEAFAYAGVTNTVTKWYIDDTNPDGPGTTRVYLATDAGPATAAPIAIVQTYLDLRRTSGSGAETANPTGILALAAVARAVSFTCTVKNSTNSSAETDSLAIITALNTESPLGALTLYKNEVIERLMGVRGTVDVPSIDLEDTVLEPGEVLTLTATISVVP